MNCSSASCLRRSEGRHAGGRTNASPFFPWRIVKSRLAVVASLALLQPVLSLAQELPSPPSSSPPATPPAGSSGPAPTPAPETKPAEQPATAPLSRDARIRELESKVERLSRAVTEMKTAPAAPPAPAPLPPS